MDLPDNNAAGDDGDGQRGRREAEPKRTPRRQHSRRRPRGLCESPSAARGSSDDPISASSSSPASSGSETESPRHTISSPGARRGRATRYELRKAAEKKFRQRYLLLQQAYEQRLQGLAVQVRHVIGELQSDATIQYLQQDPMTSEYANGRVIEIVQECFLGEREKFVKVISDQLAWQTSDLQDAQQRLRAAKRRERVVQGKSRALEDELQECRRELEVRVQTTRDLQRDMLRQQEELQRLTEERGGHLLEIEKLRMATASFGALKQELETLRIRSQDEQERERLAQDNLHRRIEELDSANQSLAIGKHAVEQENGRLRHQLSLSEASCEELTQSLRKLQAQDFPTQLLKLEHELSQQRTHIGTIEKENEQLRQKYEDFGAQVELYMEERIQEHTRIVAQSDEKIGLVRAELESARQQSASAIKTKQNEIVRLVDQLKFRQDALQKAERKASSLEERIAQLETSSAEAKLNYTKSLNDTEKDVARLGVLLEKEKEKAVDAQQRMLQATASYEQKLASLQESWDQQQIQSLKERELEARTRWQNDFVAKQEARIEALRCKYDSALESQQTELARARQLAVDAAKAAGEKVEEMKTQQQLRWDDEQETKRRLEELREAERVRAEAEKAREAIILRQQNELDDRARRLNELERRLEERHQAEERRRVEELAAAAANAKAEQTKTKNTKGSPSVVVVNLSQAKSEDEIEEKQLTVKPKRTQRKAVSRPPPREMIDDSQDTDIHQHCIALAQHDALVQAREAQIALEAEKKLQHELQHFQERKERELRNAMVNVRKGIQKLEASLESEKTHRKKLEEEILKERQTFAALRAELEDAKESKSSMLQRLEEANDNIGRLREVVKVANATADASITTLREARKEKSQAEEERNTVAEQLRESQQYVADLESIKMKMERQLSDKEETILKCEERIRELQELTSSHQQEQLNQVSASNEYHAKEIHSITTSYENKLKVIDARLQLQMEESSQQLIRSEELKKALDQVTAEKIQIENALAVSRGDISRQKNEFRDLSRIHKNLVETMNMKVQAERNNFIQMKEFYESAIRSRDRSLHSNRQALEMCLIRVHQIQADHQALKNTVDHEAKSMWLSVRHETQHTLTNLQRWITRKLDEEACKWRSKSEAENEEWKRRFDSREEEICRLLAGQKADGETKYDQLILQLQSKTEEVANLNEQLDALRQQNEKHLDSINKLKYETEAQIVEQSELQSRLTNSIVATEHDEQEKRQLRDSIAHCVQTIQAFYRFVRHVMDVYKLHLRNSKIFRKAEARRVESWSDEHLATDLAQVQLLLSQHIQDLVQAGCQAAVKPLQDEIHMAQVTLSALEGLSDTSEDDERRNAVAGSQPWYAVIARSVKQQLVRMREEITVLQASIDEKEEVSKQLTARLDDLEQSRSLIEFEKDTVAHELQLHIQSLQRKRDQDLQHMREEYERRIENIQQRHNSACAKLSDEHQLIIAQVKEALEDEKKKHNKLKQDALTTRVELEKLQFELDERPKKLQKENNEIREELGKWKRKAKQLSAKSAAGLKLTPGTPSRRMTVSSPYQHTDDESSDGSTTTGLPTAKTTPRRRSTAMADLSSRMEKSLHDLRKDHEVIEQQLQSPLRLMPPRRLTHPSPFRIAPQASPLIPRRLQRRSILDTTPSARAPPLIIDPLPDKDV